MKITDLKKEYVQKLKAALPRNAKVEFGNQILSVYWGTDIVFINKLEDTLLGGLSVQVITSSKSRMISKKNRYFSADIKEYDMPYVKRAMSILKEYWGKYLFFKKASSLIFYYERLSSKLLLPLQEVLQKEMKEEEVCLYDDLLNMRRKEFLGVILTKEGQRFLNNFFIAREIIQNIMNDNPLLSFEKNEISLNHLFFGGINFSYYGKNFIVFENNNFQELAVSFYDFEEEDGENPFIPVPLTKESIETFLLEIEEDNKLHNLIHVPMTNFKVVVETVAFEREMPNLPEMFESISEHLGSWELTEIEFSKLRHQKPEKVFSSQDKVGKASLEMFRMNTEKHSYFFLETVSKSNDYFYKFEVLVYDDPSPVEIQQKIGEVLWSF